MCKKITRSDGRTPTDLRPIDFKCGYTRYAEGSVMVSFGETRVLCNATVEEKVPPFLRGQGKGWVTAEYSMLPRATHSRSSREATRGKVGGRTHEIQRLIGRSLRAVVNLEKLGERSILIDCDVIQADGGTRTASITGAYVALSLAVKGLIDRGELKESPLVDSVSAISVGIVDGNPLLDVDYSEDSRADVDMNYVITGDGRFVEVQGTAEEVPFTIDQMDALRDLALSGCRQLTALQQGVLRG